MGCAARVRAPHVTTVPSSVGGRSGETTPGPTRPRWLAFILRFLCLGPMITSRRRTTLFKEDEWSPRATPWLEGALLVYPRL